jgi:GAF domain-containing protein
MELLDLFARQAALAIENSQTFSGLGRALFETLADAESEASSLLAETARAASGPRGELAELARVFNELARWGPEERRAAVALLSEFRDYLRARGTGR